MNNDEEAYNVCLFLNSLSGVSEAWMNEVVASVNYLEQIITGNVLPAINVPPNAGGFSWPQLGIECSDYPEVIDDLYICTKDRVYPPNQEFQTIATAGPYLVRTAERDGGEVPGIPFAAGISINVNFLDFEDLGRVILHELFHAVGL